MPIISQFFGIYIRMYFDDHNPPHFHAEYQGHVALVSIESGEIIKGKLLKKAVRLIKEWCLEHPQDLMLNWQNAVNLEPLFRISGADND